MSGYTKGPWDIEITDDKVYVLGDTAPKVVVMLYRNPTDEQAANARLIAAAPDLLEALKGLCDAADKAAGATQAGAEQVALMDLFIPIRKARAAIAKAEAQS